METVERLDQLAKGKNSEYLQGEAIEISTDRFGPLAEGQEARVEHFSLAETVRHAAELGTFALSQAVN